jgi:glutamate carboxypeptidase
MSKRIEAASGWLPSAEQVQGIRQSSVAREGAAWALLESAVAVDSSPDDLPGLEQVIKVIRPAFDELGAVTTIERTREGLPVLHARRTSDGPNNLRVLMVGHLDTVFPAGTVAGWPIDRGDGRVSAPGIADAKGGAVVMWLALASAIEVTAGLPGLDVQLILNTDEEAGSVQSRPIFEREAQTTDLALIYEPGRPDGTIVRQRRGARRYRIDVRGKAAHTGVEPWAGVNAIEAAAHKTIALQALNDRDRFLSVTVAVVSGGSRINIVPDRATLEVDTRLPDATSAEETHRSVEAIVEREDVPGSMATYEIVSDRPPLMPQQGVPAMLRRFAVAGEALGIDVRDSATGGGSDGCFISPFGVPTIDALGPVGGGYHTRDEFIHEKTLLERAQLSGLVLAGLAAEAHARDSDAS